MSLGAATHPAVPAACSLPPWAGGYWKPKRTCQPGWARSRPVPAWAVLALIDILAVWPGHYFRSPGLRLATVAEWRIFPQRSQRCWGRNYIQHPGAFQDSDLRSHGWICQRCGILSGASQRAGLVLRNEHRTGSPQEAGIWCLLSSTRLCDLGHYPPCVAVKCSRWARGSDGVGRLGEVGRASRGGADLHTWAAHPQKHGGLLPLPSRAQGGPYMGMASTRDLVECDKWKILRWHLLLQVRHLSGSFLWSIFNFYVTKETFAFLIILLHIKNEL